MAGTITLARFGVPGKEVQVLYAIFNSILVPFLALYAFYHCYKVRKAQVITANFATKTQVLPS